MDGIVNKHLKLFFRSNFLRLTYETLPSPHNHNAPPSICPVHYLFFLQMATCSVPIAEIVLFPGILS